MVIGETSVSFFIDFLLIILIVLKIISYVTMSVCKSDTCLLGKTVLITGGNAGLGYETALSLASRGARVIIADRDDTRATKRNIIEHTNNGNIICKYVDLSSFTSVRKLAKEINEEEGHLDILINNAGEGVFHTTLTEDGLPLGIQVNFLGAFLLTHLLIDLLKKSAPSRILFVSSLLAFTNNLTLDNLDKIPKVPQPFQDVVLYGNTKLMNIIGANIFAEKLDGSGVTSNSLHPGLARTGIFRKCKEMDSVRLLINLFILDPIIWLFGKSPREGAQTHIYCSVAKDLEHVTGKFFVECREFMQPWKTRRRDYCMNLWKKCEEFCKLTAEEKL